MVQAQMQHNLKLQSMLDSQFAQARPSPIVETAAMTTTATETVTPSATGFEFVRPTSKAVAAAPPPKTNFPPTPKRPIVFSPPQGRTLGKEDEIEIVYHDPKYSGPTQVKKEPGISRSSDAPRPPEGAAASLFGANPSNKRGGSPVPMQRYSLTDLGPDDMDYFEPGDDDGPDGNDPGDGGDGNGGGGDGPPTPPEPNDYHPGKKNKTGSDPPDGGDGGDNDPDKNEEDDESSVLG